MILESLGNNQDTRRFVELIVDSYVNAKHFIVDNSKPYIANPGIEVGNIFTDFENAINLNSCGISMRKNEHEIYNTIEICYVIKKALYENISDDLSHDIIDDFIKNQRCQIIEKIVWLKWLVDAGYIYLVDSGNNNLFYSKGYTSEDVARWDKYGLKPFTENLRSDELFSFISKNYSSRIIPSPQLIDLRNNNFETPEQRRFSKTQAKTDKALSYAKRSNIIAIAAALISLIASILIYKFIPISIDKSQHKEVIENIKTLNNEQTEDAKP